MVKVLFDQNYMELKSSDIRNAFKGDSRLMSLSPDLLKEDIINLFVASKLLPSKCTFD